MCRLVAYTGGPASPAGLVFGGAHSLYEQSWAPQELLSGSVNVAVESFGSPEAPPTEEWERISNSARVLEGVLDAP